MKIELGMVFCGMNCSLNAFYYDIEVMPVSYDGTG